MIANNFGCQQSSSAIAMRIDLSGDVSSLSELFPPKLVHRMAQNALVPKW